MVTYFRTFSFGQNFETVSLVNRKSNSISLVSMNSIYSDLENKLTDSGFETQKLKKREEKVTLR